MTRPNDAVAAGLHASDQTTSTNAVPSGSRAIREIEAAADFYDPQKYAELSFDQDIRVELDPLDAEFIPITQVRRNPKMFVVGIVPPQSTVTGKLLDRSASIRSILQAPAKTASLEVDTSLGVGEPEPTVGTGKTSAALALPPQFWIEFVSMCEDLKVDPMAMGAVIYNESRFDSNARNQQGSTDAKSIGQIIHPTAQKMGMSEETWERFHEMSAREQLPYVEQYLRRSGVKDNPKQTETQNATRIYQVWFGGYNNNKFGLGKGYANKAAQESAIANLQAELYALQSKPHPTKNESRRIANLEATIAAGFTESDFQNTAYNQNKALDYNHDGVVNEDDLQHVVKHLPPPAVRNLLQNAIDSGQRSERLPRREDVTEQEEPAPDWNKKGSEAAAEEQEQRDSLADTGYNNTTLGQQYTTAQLVHIKETQDVIDRMKKTPPLRMLVNPASFAVKKEKVAADGNRSRTGPIIEHFTDNQDKISASGQVAGFFAVDATNAVGPGLTRTARNFSAGYRNFIALYQLYRNNAGLYMSPTGGDDRNLSVLGSIYLYYDNILYFGSFDSFNISEEDGKPFTLNYSWEFSVRATFLLDRPQDPGISYGVQADKYFASEKVKLPTQYAYDSTGRRVALPTFIEEEG